MEKICIYEMCKHEFIGYDELYEKCPSCGAGTVPYKTELNHKALIYASKCPHSIDCYFYGHYQPSCEDKVFSVDCLIPISTEISAVNHKLDKLLALLEQK